MKLICWFANIYPTNIICIQPRYDNMIVGMPCNLYVYICIYREDERQANSPCKVSHIVIMYKIHPYWQHVWKAMQMCDFFIYDIRHTDLMRVSAKIISWLPPNRNWYRVFPIEILRRFKLIRICVMLGVHCFPIISISNAFQTCWYTQ